MGFLDTLRDALALPSLAAHPVPAASPFSWPNHLYPVDTSAVPPLVGLTRQTAMRVPAVARARRLIVGSIARCPLVAYRGEVEVTPSPRWIDRTDGPLSPVTRMVWTVDDLLFHGWSLWAAERDAAGLVVAADRVPIDEWSFSDGTILYHGAPVADDAVILIPGMDAGLLTDGVDAVDHAATVNAAAGKAAKNPSAQIELHQTGGEPLTGDAVTKLVGDWVSARRGENGGVAYTNESIEVKEHGAANEHLLVEGRNAAAVDVARATGIPASLLDAEVPGSSMNYSNVEARNAEFVDLCLAPHMATIAARLGMDDVVAPGVRVEFDLTPITGVALSSLSVPDDRRPEVPR